MNMLDERLIESPVVVSISGGKDSTAAALWCRENDIPFRLLHMDTGWERPETEAYVREYLPNALGVPVEIVGHPGGMPALIKKKRGFPSRRRRWCTELLKLRPAKRWVAEQYDEPIVMVVGIRAEESARRARMPEWEEADYFDGWTFRPLIRWTLDDVIAIHRRHDVVPNPIYLEGGSTAGTRVGCDPCVFSRKSELREFGNRPQSLQRLRDLEQWVADEWAAGRGPRGDEGKQVQPSTFFQARSPIEGRYPCVPIDDVVTWAKTSRGGRQFELFASEARDEGCMRWGLCDTGSSEDLT